MKITVYTIKDCAFSKQEKEYLTSHSLPYEEKDLETNKEFLTEMLAISSNFAGTPVTRVEKDDGTIAVLKGFTKGEFDKTLGFSAEPPITEVKPAEEPAKPAEAPSTPPQPASAEASTGKPPVVKPPKEEPKSDELNAVINKLEEKTETPPAQSFDSAQDKPTSTNSTNSTDSTVPPANPPNIPDFSSDIKTTA